MSMYSQYYAPGQVTEFLEELAIGILEGTVVMKQVEVRSAFGEPQTIALELVDLGKPITYYPLRSEEV